MSAAVNRLLRRSLPGKSERSAPRWRRNGFLISRGRKPITADDIARAEAEDDDAGLLPR